MLAWFPLAAGGLARAGTLLDEIAAKLGATTAQVALAWVLKRSPVMLPIPGTSKVAHLDENAAAAQLALSDDDFRRLDAAGQQVWESQKH